MRRRSERLNVCLTPHVRNSLQKIAQRENRDAGYVAAQLVEWGLRQYLEIGASLVFLNESKAVRDERLEKTARARLVLREEAQQLNAANVPVERKTKRAS